MTTKEAIEFALRNRFITDDTFKEMIAKAEAAEDWAGVCPKCKAQLKGTLAQLREHKC